ncbi:hypothetical protein C8J45_11357 [Sphingomonas sp. PP-CE-3G-477]|uniref:hypothetical protein n=1 Tax=Sphingomonas sp. PP-CE-3G-477 TaxID=2135660 RepID=UPI000D393DCA|nr:hypothetical protein [Sphingomonas sp. PP-CE-3G-477]PTQ60106.1 hypothetical protein C8J45_11357 [Sphingomonas sp. PP-CE-3G-477]
MQHTAALLATALIATPASAQQPAATHKPAATTCHVLIDDAYRPAGKWSGYHPIGRWGGSCRGDLADGLGAIPVRTSQGDEGVFAGRAEAGRLRSGIININKGGFQMIAPEQTETPEGIDPAAWASNLAFNNAFAGAAEASARYRAAGNTASANYYARLRAKLIAGQPE